MPPTIRILSSDEVLKSISKQREDQQTALAAQAKAAPKKPASGPIDEPYMIPPLPSGLELCDFPEWNLQHVKFLIDVETNGAPTQQAAPPVKGAKGKVEEAPQFSTKILEIPPTKDLPQLQPEFREWRGIHSKAKVKLNRKLTPLNPFLFSKQETSRPSSTASAPPADPKAKKTTQPPPVEPAADPEKEEANEAFAKELDQEFEFQAQEDYENYCDFVKLEQKGRRCRPFISALYAIKHYFKQIEVGNYLWELIYPKRTDFDYLPDKSSFKKYIIKLYMKGSFRIVVIDDLLPFNMDGVLMLPETKQGELWPSILFKGLLRAAEGNEDLVFNNPLWCFHTLTGYSFHTLDLSSEALCIKYLLQTLHKTFDESERKTNSIADFLKLRKAMKANEEITQIEQNLLKDKICRYVVFASCKIEMTEELKKHGLESSKLYAVNDIKFNGANILLRIFGTKISWKGSFSYDHIDIWNPTLEQNLLFSKQDRINETAKMCDFWISLEEFQQLFSSIHIGRFCLFLERPIFQFSSTNTLWISIPENTSLMMRYHALNSKLIENSSESCLVSLESFRWGFLKPNHFMGTVTLPKNSTEIISVLEPSVEKRVVSISLQETTSDQSNTLVDILIDNSIVAGSFKDVLRNDNLYYVQTENMEHEAVTPDEFQLLMFRTLDGPSISSIAQLQLQLADQNIIPHIIFALVNQITSKSIYAQLCTLSQVTLENNTSYALIAYIKSKHQKFEKNVFSLSHIANNFGLVTQNVSQRFPVTLSGEYIPNSDMELFRFEVWVGDPTLSVYHISLNKNVPTTFQILCNDEIIYEDKIDEKLYVVVPCVKLHPSSKTEVKKYVYRAIISSHYANSLFMKRLETADQTFESKIEDLLTNTKEILTDVYEAERKRRAEERRSKKGPPKPAAKAALKAKPALGPKIPAKQEKPQIIQIETSSNSTDQLKYNMQLVFSSPNVIIEATDARRQKMDQMKEEWEAIESGRSNMGNAARQKFYQEYIRRNMQQQNNSNWLQRGLSSWLDGELKQASKPLETSFSTGQIQQKVEESFAQVQESQKLVTDALSKPTFDSIDVPAFEVSMDRAISQTKTDIIEVKKQRLQFVQKQIEEAIELFKQKEAEEKARAKK